MDLFADYRARGARGSSSDCGCDKKSVRTRGHGWRISQAGLLGPSRQQQCQEDNHNLPATSHTTIGDLTKKFGVSLALGEIQLMLGSDKSRGYMLEIICADFVAGANL